MEFTNGVFIRQYAERSLFTTQSIISLRATTPPTKIGSMRQSEKCTAVAFYSKKTPLKRTLAALCKEVASFTQNAFSGQKMIQISQKNTQISFGILTIQKLSLKLINQCS